MESIESEELYYAKQTQGRREIAYTHDFKDFFHQSENSLQKVKSYIDQLSGKENMGETVEDENISVTYIDRNPGFERKYFRVLDKITNAEFFVKVADKDKEGLSGGTTELMLMSEVKDKLKGIPGVRVIDYKFGYKGREKSYLVASYEPELQTTLDITLLKMRKEDETKYHDLIRRFNQITQVLNGTGDKYYADLDKRNMAYDSVKDEIVIFDLYTL